jgi:hypothetical protein
VIKSDRRESELDSIRRRLGEGEFSFIDGGCGIGGSMDYCQKTFGRGIGIGFDSSFDKIERAKLAGHTACVADMKSISLPENCVSFVSFLDVLEHLPDIETTESILENMATLAHDFIFIRHPSFEDIEYLRGHGLKLTWTDWHGHPNMMSLADFDDVFHRLSWSAPTVLGQKPIADSSHPSIVPENAPRDTIDYDPKLHREKRSIKFDRAIYSQFDIFVRLNDELTAREWTGITKSVANLRNQTKALAPIGI